MEATEEVANIEILEEESEEDGQDLKAVIPAEDEESEESDGEEEIMQLIDLVS